MNAVYPLGNGSKWDNNELRYSVKSLSLFTNIDKVFVIGQLFDGELALPFENIPYRETQNPAVNIWEKLVEACVTPQISDPFLFINDDHYFTRPVDIDSYPNYYAYMIDDYPYMHQWVKGTNLNMLDNPYYKLVKRTRDILGNVKFFNVHCPCIIHKEKFLRTFEQYRSEIYTDIGLLIKTTYLQNEPGEVMTDYKIRFRESFDSVIDKIRDRHIFSSGEFVDPDTMKVLQTIFNTVK
jgi:hypothetical protein